MRTSDKTPWWLRDGTETCASCSHRHVYEMEFRCVACDRGICCHCVGIRVAAGDVLCGECAAEAEEE